jgi:hypothetical protein
MTTTKARIMRAIDATAAQITQDSIPPLRLPTDDAGWNGSGRLAGRAGSRLRWLAPAAAAAAVLTIAVGVSVIGGRPHHSGPATGTSRLCAACLREARRVPPNYMALTRTNRPHPDYHRYIGGIYQTRTGAQIITFATGARQTIVDVSAAANDRVFAIAVQAEYPAGLPATHFYLIHVDVSGTSLYSSGQVMELPAGAGFSAFALSPDGSELAVAFEPYQNAPKLTAEIRVLNIRTHKLHTWTSSQGAVEGFSTDPQSMSWAADNATLAFNWYGFRKGIDSLLPTSGLRLLDVAALGNSVVAGSRLSVPIFIRDQRRATSAGYLSDILMLTPDGKTVVGAISAFRGNNGGFAEFSAATGRLERRLGWGPMSGPRTGGPMDVLWASSDGSNLVVYAPPGHWNRIGILHGDKLTLLPQPSMTGFPGATW